MLQFEKTGVIAILVCSITVIEIAKVKTQPYPIFFFYRLPCFDMRFPPGTSVGKVDEEIGKQHG